MIYNTYIICNSKLIDSLRTIKEFQLDLGKSLTSVDGKENTTRRHPFLPSDTIIQSHYTFHNEIIHRLGSLGTLNIYTSNSVESNKVAIINMDKKLEFVINSSVVFYDFLNTSLGVFLEHFKLVNINQVSNANDSIDDNGTTNSMFSTKNVYDNSDYEPEGILNENVSRPVIDLETVSNNSKNEIDYEQVKDIPFKDMTMEQRIIYARNRK